MHPATFRKLWIDPAGKRNPVRDGHEDWAHRHGHELEDLLDAGWVRVQAVPPAYLYLDLCRPITEPQAMAVARLFKKRYEQVVIEFVGEVREFADGNEALRCVLGLR